jgi:hypothetical protein
MYGRHYYFQFLWPLITFILTSLPALSFASTLPTPELDVRELGALASEGGSGIGGTVAERFAASEAKVH